MIYPKLRETVSETNNVDVFGGYNHNLRPSEGEFYDMKNLCDRYYPVLSQRPLRGQQHAGAVSGMIDKDGLWIIEGSEIVLPDGTRIDMELSEGEKQLISMGAYIIILPDAKYINSKDVEDRGQIEASVTTQNEVTFTLCRMDGGEIDATVSDTAPTEPIGGDYWIDTSETPHTLKQYAASMSMWNDVATTYIKISATGIGAPFAEGDAVQITGATGEADALNGSQIVQGCGEDYLIVVGILSEIFTQDESLCVTRRMPLMDFVTESGNRLWGCRYGTDLEGNIVNEIYACSLGDFKNWENFEGSSGDAYRLSLGSDGPFTGAITYGGYPTFFKEGCLHKIYGSIPAEFSLQTTPCRGVAPGAAKSLCIVGERLYYQSRAGVCEYDGSLPRDISAAFGEKRYHGGVGGCEGARYYLSLLDDSDAPQLFVYHTSRGLWHKEDNIRVRSFCASGGELYYLEEGCGGIGTVLGSGDLPGEREVSWYAETGVIAATSPEKKYVTRMDIRLSQGIGTRVHFFIQYDSGDHWEYLYTMVGSVLRSVSVPIRPRRCDHFRLRMEGAGEVKLYAICKTMERGEV